MVYGKCRRHRIGALREVLVVILYIGRRHANGAVARVVIRVHYALDYIHAAYGVAVI